MEQAQQQRQQAITEGQRAAILRLPASLNPYPDDSDAHTEWERARFNTQGRLLARAA